MSILPLEVYNIFSKCKDLYIIFLGPLMFGFHDGQSEAPKIMAKKVNIIFFCGHFCQDVARDLKGQESLKCK